MMRFAIILILIGTLNAVAEPTAYMDMVLRARNAAEARDRLGITISSGGSNGQPARLNLTNWSAIGTNILTNMVFTTNLVAQTNTFWERIFTYESAMDFTNVGWMGDFDITNVLWTFTVTNSDMIRVDLVDAWYRQTGGGTTVDANFYLLLGYTERNGGPLSQNMFGSMGDTDSHMPDQTGAETWNSDYNLRLAKSFLIHPKVGTTVSITNRMINSINDALEAHGTNYCRIEVSKAPESVTLKWR